MDTMVRRIVKRVIWITVFVTIAINIRLTSKLFHDNNLFSDWVEDRTTDVEAWYKSMDVSIEINANTNYSISSIEKFVNPVLFGNKNGSIIVLKYPKFDLKPPIFPNKSDELLFYKNNKNLYLFRSQNWLNRSRGEIHLIVNGSTHRKYDCGWFPSLSKYYLVPTGKAEDLHITDQIVAPIFVPASHAFQEFLNGVLPKIVQIWPFILRGAVKLLLFKPRDNIIYELLARIGVPDEQVIFQPNIDQLTQVSYQVNTCIAPPLHPALWTKIRNLLRVKNTLSQGSFIIFISRNEGNTKNRGRFVKNENEVVSFLRTKYGSSMVLIYYGQFNSLNETIYFFSRARILIGVHGGGLFNVMFCPSDTTVVEYVPTYKDGSTAPTNLAHTSVWTQTNLIGQKLFRLTQLPLNERGDIYIEISKLNQTLNEI